MRFLAPRSTSTVMLVSLRHGWQQQASTGWGGVVGQATPSKSWGVKRGGTRAASRQAGAAAACEQLPSAQTSQSGSNSTTTQAMSWHARPKPPAPEGHTGGAGQLRQPALVAIHSLAPRPVGIVVLQRPRQQAAAIKHQGHSPLIGRSLQACTALNDPPPADK